MATKYPGKAHLSEYLRTIEKNNYVDVETGEVIEGEPIVNRFKYLKKKDEFFIAYTLLLKALQLESDIKMADVKVYAYLLENYKVGVTIAINTQVRDDISIATKVSPQSVYNSIARLCKTEIPFLFKINRGSYKLNPRFAFKGSTSDRNKHLKAIIELGCTDC